MERCIALILVSCLAFVVVAESHLVGGWKPIKNLKQAHLKHIADFAVAMHNKKSNANLELTDVLKGEMQVVSGIKYRLVLEAKSKTGGKCKNYEAVVGEEAFKKTKKTLLSFKLLGAAKAQMMIN